MNVFWNGFDVVGCYGFLYGLLKNSIFVDLDLCFNRVGIIGFFKLVEGMKRNFIFEVLRVCLFKKKKFYYELLFYFFDKYVIR